MIVCQSWLQCSSHTPACAHEVCIVGFKGLVEALCQVVLPLQELRFQALADLERVVQAALVLVRVAGTLLHEQLVIASGLLQGIQHMLVSNSHRPTGHGIDCGREKYARSDTPDVLLKQL